jgi:hypothetical protein
MTEIIENCDGKLRVTSTDAREYDIPELQRQLTETNKRLNNIQTFADVQKQPHLRRKEYLENLIYQATQLGITENP